MKLSLLLMTLMALECCQGRKWWLSVKDGPYDVGQDLDTFLVQFNQQMKSSGSVTFPLKDFSLAGAEGRGVEVGRFDTVVRTGRASVASSGTVFLANVTVGLKDCFLSVREFTYQNRTSPLAFQIEDNSVQLAYAVDLINKTNCTLTWSVFELLKLDRVKTRSPDPAFNNIDVSTIFRNTVLPQLNRHLATPGFLKFLDTSVNPCLHREYSLDDPLAQLQRLVLIY